MIQYKTLAQPQTLTQESSRLSCLKDCFLYLKRAQSQSRPTWQALLSEDSLNPQLREKLQALYTKHYLPQNLHAELRTLVRGLPDISTTQGYLLFMDQVIFKWGPNNVYDDAWLDPQVVKFIHEGIEREAMIQGWFHGTRESGNPISDVSDAYRAQLKAEIMEGDFVEQGWAGYLGLSTEEVSEVNTPSFREWNKIFQDKQKCSANCMSKPHMFPHNLQNKQELFKNRTENPAYNKPYKYALGLLSPPSSLHFFSNDSAGVFKSLELTNNFLMDLQPEDKNPVFHTGFLHAEHIRVLLSEGMLRERLSAEYSF